MERREDIRAAMHSLLSSGRRHDGGAQGRREPDAPLTVEPATGRPAEALSLSDAQQRVLREVQAELREYGVAADVTDIVQALMEALASRPGLCRGLVAAHLLGRPGPRP